MNITTVFKNSSEAPITGLVPLISINDITDILNPIVVITDESMIDVGNGFYAYDFSTFEEQKDYTVLINANSVITGRYQYGAINKFTLDTEVEGDLGIREMIRVMFAVLAGTSTGGGTNVVRFKSQDGIKNRIEAAVDNNGNRLSVNIIPS